MPTKVLAIDNDTATTGLLAQLLGGHGYQVIRASSGADGISSVQTESPDVVILDVRMPGLDGGELCRTLRTFSDVPVLVLSAIDSPAAVTAALDAGADDYLIKPVPAGVLIAHINNLARRAVAQRESGSMGRQAGSSFIQNTFHY